MTSLPTSPSLKASNLLLHSVKIHQVNATAPAPPHLLSLAPSDYVIGAALSVAMVAFCWPNDHDETVLLAGLSAALSGYPTLAGRLHAGGKVGAARNGRVYSALHAVHACHRYLRWMYPKLLLVSFQ